LDGVVAAVLVVFEFCQHLLVVYFLGGFFFPSGIQSQLLVSFSGS
jgi:hypothetical protein